MHSPLNKKALRKGQIYISAITLFGVGILTLALLFPAELAMFVQQVSPGCWFRKLTGLACPGCGGTRATGALLRGDILGALRYNLLLPIGVLVLLLEYIRQVRIYFFRLKDWRNCIVYIRFLQGFALLVAVWALLRNFLGI